MSWHLLTGVLGVFDIISIISSLFKSCKNTLPKTTIGDSLLAELSSVTNYHSNVSFAAVMSLLYLPQLNCIGECSRAHFLPC